MGGKKKKSKDVNKIEQNVNNEQKVKNSLTDSNNDTKFHNQNNEVSQKRKYVSSEVTDFSSDTETKRKKPKKKKIPDSSESAAKKNKKSIRQMKKEKHAERQAAALTIAKDQLKSQCLNYLSQWKHDRSNWKFMKAKQLWLLKNKFSSNLIPDSSWPTLLEYFESSKGNVRNILLTDANKIIKQMDDWTESQNNEQDKDNNIINTDIEEPQDSVINKPEETVYRRARSLIQCLEE